MFASSRPCFTGAAPEHPLKRPTVGFLGPPRWAVMGLAAEAGGFTLSFLALGVGAVIAVVAYDWVRGSGIPILGKQATNGVADVYNGG